MNDDPIKVQITHLYWKAPGKLAKSKTKIEYEYVVNLDKHYQEAILERGVRHITINHYRLEDENVHSSNDNGKPVICSQSSTGN